MLRIRWHRRYTPVALLLALLLNVAQTQLVLHELRDHLFAHSQTVNEHCLQLHVQGSALVGEVYHQAVIPVTPVFEPPTRYSYHSLVSVVYYSRGPPAAHSAA